MNFQEFNSSRTRQIERNNYDTLSVYVGLEQISDMGRIVIYVPFDKMDKIGCLFYNSLVENIDNRNLNIRLIPTSSIMQLDDDNKFTDAMYVEFAPEHKNIVKSMIEFTIENKVEWK
jgi:F0F1-type ATP synthase gamma subunit